MDKIKLWILLTICLMKLHYVDVAFMQFTNITCESKDRNLSTVELCQVVKINRLKNYISFRYSLMQPLIKDIGLHLQLLIRSNGWKPFIYNVNIDLCRFWKSRYNSIGKMIFGMAKGHSNMNHSCPYVHEKSIIFDKLMNTDISKKLHGIPLGKAHYALSNKWSWKNITRMETVIYFEILND